MPEDCAMEEVSLCQNIYGRIRDKHMHSTYYACACHECYYSIARSLMIMVWTMYRCCHIVQWAWNHHGPIIRKAFCLPIGSQIKGIGTAALNPHSPMLVDMLRYIIYTCVCVLRPAYIAENFRGTICTLLPRGACAHALDCLFSVMGILLLVLVSTLLLLSSIVGLLT